MAESPEEGNGMEDFRRSPPGPTEIRSHLAGRPKPSVPQRYNVEESAFWLHRHLPPGSVIRFDEKPEKEGEDAVPVALYVTRTESLDTGVWLDVEFLGSPEESVKKKWQNYFKQKRRRVHICYLEGDGSCPIGEDKGLHLRDFWWFPPGDFIGNWLSAAAKKKVKGGPALEVQSRGDAGQEKPREPEEPSRTEQRLAALRSGRRHVSFAPGTRAGRAASPEKGGGEAPRVGVLRHSGTYSALADSRPSTEMVKQEVVDLTRGTSRSKTPEKKKKKPRVAVALAQAAVAHQQAEVKREEKERGRSKSRKKRKRDKRKRRGSPSSSSSSSRETSSDSSSLMPPLKKKSLRKPGSVMKMLEQQAFDFLAQDGIIDPDDEDAENNFKPKLYTYYQLGLKPGLDPKSPDAKELALLCKALDVLRDGKLDRLGDLLAARLIAVDTATRQGWSTAKHLEILNPDEEGTAPAHILLQAQKHGKQVERAGGKGSWTRAQAWNPDWYSEPRGKGKGKDPKGKGKKGKGRGKGGKNWNVWGAAADKEKADGKKPGETPG
eukprot:s2158_g5.t1